MIQDESVVRSCYFRWGELIVTVINPGLSWVLTGSSNLHWQHRPWQAPRPTQQALGISSHPRLTRAPSCEQAVLQFLGQAPPSGSKVE